MQEPATTMTAALSATATRYPENGFTFQDAEGREETISFASLRDLARGLAGALQAQGIRPRARVGLIESDVRRFVLLFFALLEAGAVPVPLAPPTAVTARSIYLGQVRSVLRAASARHLLVNPSLLPLDETFAPPEELTMLETTALAVSPDAFRPVVVEPSDLAFLQFTSGSTGRPKGARITHAALTANIRAFMQRLEADPARDRGISWLPLYHDMGLIGFVLAPLYWGVSCVLMPTTRFVRKPSAWLDAIHRHRGTITFAPSFAATLLMRRIRSEEASNWDLSCIKAFGCGAEPIHADTLRRLVEHFRVSGLESKMLVPAYGLAESCLAVTMKHVGAPFVVDQRARDDGGVVDHVGCGEPLDGHRVEIRDPSGQPLFDGLEGEIWTTGPSLADGYERHGQASAFEQGWLRTGDLGYVRDGQLFVTGRSKDIIIIHGRNHHPQTFEWAASEVSGVRTGNVVAFSRPGEGTEELIILAEVARPRPDLARAIAVAVQQECGVTPSDIRLMAPGTLPKTSSGKLRRGEARKAFLDGTFA